ncbi:MAG TPA: hypothetical protein VLC93_00885, partial [Myxococcota bacterium]|nr:hypothetical protein [Myxococcota bacterium]
MPINAQGGVVYLGRTAPLAVIGSGLAGEPPAITKPKPLTANVAQEPAPKPQAPKAPTTLPTEGEPPPAGAQPAMSRSELAIRQAMLGKSPGKLVSTLVAWRAQGEDGARKIEEFAAAMARNLGMSIDDARLLTNAMSLGLLDSRAIAEGINALRTMDGYQRADWMNRWLPVARAGARALLALAEDPVMKSLGATPAIANALGDLAATTILMVDRNKKLPPGTTLEGRAEAARTKTIERAMKPNGSALLMEAGKVGAGEAVNMNAREALAHDLMGRYKISMELALQLVDAMRNKTQVGRMIAEGMQELEKVGGGNGDFAPSFFHHVQKALAVEATIAADPFKRELGPTNEAEIMPIANLAEFIDQLDYYAAVIAERQAAA